MCGRMARYSATSELCLCLYFPPPDPALLRRQRSPIAGFAGDIRLELLDPAPDRGLTKPRIPYRRRSTLALVHNHPGQVMHGLFPKRVTDTVLDAMTDHEKLSMQVLDDPERQRDFALLILHLLTAGTGDQRTIPTRPAQ